MPNLIPETYSSCSFKFQPHGIVRNSSVHARHGLPTPSSNHISNGSRARDLPSRKPRQLLCVQCRSLDTGTRSTTMTTQSSGVPKLTLLCNGTAPLRCKSTLLRSLAEAQKVAKDTKLTDKYPQKNFKKIKKIETPKKNKNQKNFKIRGTHKGLRIAPAMFSFFLMWCRGRELRVCIVGFCSMSFLNLRGLLRPIGCRFACGHSPKSLHWRSRLDINQRVRNQDPAFSSLWHTLERRWFFKTLQIKRTTSDGIARTRLHTLADIAYHCIRGSHWHPLAPTTSILMRQRCWQNVPKGRYVVTKKCLTFRLASGCLSNHDTNVNPAMCFLSHISAIIFAMPILYSLYSKLALATRGPLFAQLPHALSGPDGSRHSSDQKARDVNSESANYCPI